MAPAPSRSVSNSAESNTLVSHIIMYIVNVRYELEWKERAACPVVHTSGFTLQNPMRVAHHRGHLYVDLVDLSNIADLSLKGSFSNGGVELAGVVFGLTR